MQVWHTRQAEDLKIKAKLLLNIFWCEYDTLVRPRFLTWLSECHWCLQQYFLKFLSKSTDIYAVNLLTRTPQVCNILGSWRYWTTHRVAVQVRTGRLRRQAAETPSSLLEPSWWERSSSSSCCLQAKRKKKLFLKNFVKTAVSITAVCTLLDI